MHNCGLELFKTKLDKPIFLPPPSLNSTVFVWESYENVYHILKQ